MLTSATGQTIEPKIFSLKFIFLAPLKKIERYFKLLELRDFSC